MDESGIIRRHFSPLTLGRPEALNLTDDAASLSVPEGRELVITTDAISESIDFIGSETPAQIAQKLLRVNLSDLAAKGATPLAYTLTLLCPDAPQESWLENFCHGLAQDQREFGLFLLGGDMSRIHGKLTLSATIFGHVPHGSMIKRGGAQAGDGIYVSGAIGLSHLGLRLMQGESWDMEETLQQTLRDRYLLPQPRVELGQKLRGIATACMDISDGLVQDMTQLCHASNCGAELYTDAVPLPAWKQAPSLRDALLAGGDDYELLFTASDKHADNIAALGCYRIGTIIEGSSVRWLDREGEDVTFTHRGYSHF